MKAFKGKTAVVTGAASGIGLALARRFAKEGMNVVLADIEEPALSQAAASIESEMGVLAVQTDVTKYEELVVLRDQTFAKFGTAHIVCNNAGVGVGGFVEEISVEDWRWVMEVDLFGVIWGIKVFLPKMLEQNEGHFVNTSSIGGLGTAPTHGPYVVSKFGVVAISEVLKQEMQMRGANVSVTALCPGRIATRIFDSHRNRPGGRDQEPTDAEKQYFAAGMPPDEVAGIVLEAIENDRLIVFTHKWLIPLVTNRFKAITEMLETQPYLEGTENPQKYG